MMRRLTRGSDGWLRQVAGNVTARAVAIAALTAATILIARTGGAGAVGSYALLRMLPGLVGVLAVLGLPNAMAFFLAPGRGEHRSVWPTIAMIAASGAAAGTVLWWLLTPVLRHLFFPHDSTALLLLTGLTVASQLVMTLGKTALQGLQQRRTADLAIAAEEVAFLPLFVVGTRVTGHGDATIVWALMGADLLVGLWAWHRVARSEQWTRWGLAGPPHGWWGRPDRRLAKEIASYGTRGQVGGLMTLLNARLDFMLLGAMAGPAVLGTYAVASKYAELLRLPSLALSWTAYPRLAALPPEVAAQRARRIAGPALLGVVAIAVPALLLAGPVTHLLYGDGFDSAIVPAQILVLGMVLSGAAGAATGLLYAQGRPGINSLLLGLGLVVTVVLDLLLIPRHEAIGASIASTSAYLLSDGALVLLLLWSTRTARAPTSTRAAVVVPLTTDTTVAVAPHDAQRRSAGRAS